MNIKDIIPQRKPFLFIDKIIEHDSQNLKAEFTFHEDLDFFKGHFPNNPIVPGVILNEACFQSAAALIGATKVQSAKKDLAVVSRIQSAKFKQMVRPNETIIIDTTLVEMIDQAAYFKSIIRNQEKQKVLIIEFACTLIKEN